MAQITNKEIYSKRQPSEERAAGIQTPAINLPKGGGAIRGIGEKFAANPVTGTGSMSIPIATSLGRLGFGTQLFLSYNSGTGNGPFGWSLSIPQSPARPTKDYPNIRMVRGKRLTATFSDSRVQRIWCRLLLRMPKGNGFPKPSRRARLTAKSTSSGLKFFKLRSTRYAT